MRTGLPIILFVAVAGFHNAISASLEIDESNKSPEERVYEENSTRTQPDESEYAAAHVTAEDILRTTLTDGETEALTYYTEKRNDEESEETKALEQKDSDDAEKAALADSPAHSEEGEENMRSIEENSDEFYEEEYQLAS